MYFIKPPPVEGIH